MNNLQVFSNPEFAGVRVVVENDEPWFVASDVANALGYQNPRDAIVKHVDEEDKGVSEMLTPGGRQKTTLINESGLYSLVLQSKLPSAKRFKRWVTHEVLPAIRRTGRYAVEFKTLGGRPDGVPDYTRMKAQLEDFILAVMSDEVILRKKMEQLTRVATNAGKLRLAIERLMQMQEAVEEKDYDRLYTEAERRTPLL